MERGNIEMERDNIKREIRVREEENFRLKTNIFSFERKLVDSKHLISNLMNLILISENNDIID